MSLSLNLRNIKPTFYFKLACRNKCKRWPLLSIKKIKPIECHFNPRSKSPAGLSTKIDFITHVRAGA